MGTDLRLADGKEQERFRFMNGVFTRDRTAGGKTLVYGAYLEAAYDDGPLILTGGVRLDRSKAYDSTRIERDIQTGAVLISQRSPEREDTTPTGVPPPLRTYWVA